MPVQNMAWVWAAYSSGNHAPAEDEAEQVDGIEAGEAGFPEAGAVELAVAGLGRVVVGKHKAGEQDEEADGSKAGIDHGGQEAEPLGIGKVEEDNVEGREAAQACKRIQPGWLARLSTVS